MKLRLMFIFIVTVTVFLFRCAAPVAVTPQQPAPIKEKPIPVPKATPIIRVGLLKNISSIEFSADTRFEMTNNENGSSCMQSPAGRWRVEVVQSVPGKTALRILLMSSDDQAKVREQANRYERAGYPVDVSSTNHTPKLQIQGLNNNREYKIYLKRSFETWDDARAYQKAVWPDMDTHIVRATVTEAKGRFRLTQLSTGKSFESDRPIVVRGADITLYDIPVGTGFHWETKENRTYPEKIEFTLDIDGKLAVINVVPLEIYLKGVVPSEMAEGFPFEALKAQAIAARCKAMANWGITHVSDPFDVCAEVHCQVYSGLSKRTRKTDYAVEKTMGLFMVRNDKICDAIFGAVCGGHTENVENAWNGESVDYLRGRIDGSPWLKRYGPLDREENLRRWIDDPPDAFCNTQKDKVIDGLQYTVKYFRWEVALNQADLQQSLEKRIGLQLGEILDMVPLLRGVSGRIIRLKVIGTKSETIIDGELNIRKALSPTTLWSSCFYIEKSGWMRVPDQFILKGGGFGHGVGMCQTGAAMMALKGRKFHHILKHYYQGIQIKKFY